MNTGSFPSQPTRVMAVVFGLVALSGISSLLAGSTAGLPAGMGGGHATAASAGSSHAVTPMASVRSAGFSRAGTGLSHAYAGSVAPISRAPAGRVATVPLAGPVSRVALSRPAPQARNAWTDPTDLTSSHGTGQFLYSEAPRDIIGNNSVAGRKYVGANHSWRGRNWRYGSYGYGYPGIIVSGSSPYGYGDYAGVVDPVGDYAGVAPSGVGETVESPSVAANEPARVYSILSYVQPTPAAEADAQPPAAKNLRSDSGPDSLVEAVQAELSRRGYFGGKVDAVYNDATHVAIERFQADQKLPASGRINEATLHALALD